MSRGTTGLSPHPDPALPRSLLPSYHFRAETPAITISSLSSRAPPISIGPSDIFFYAHEFLGSPGARDPETVWAKGMAGGLVRIRCCGALDRKDLESTFRI